MNTYPAAGDYYKAVQAPARAFTVPKLQRAEFVWDALGPTLARGSSAVVFQAAVEGSPQAVRCYIRDDASSWERYSALGEYLAGRHLDPFVSPVTWIDEAIQVNGATWPVLQMPWIDGRTLNEYVDYLVAGSNAAALTMLATKWRELIALLQGAEFAHGDLQHGNVLVDQEGTLRLVDFDGIWIPQLTGLGPPTEYGHPNYQHPNQHVWGRWLDTFSALVIYLSLVALSKDPALWLALYNCKNLLFSKSDFYPPYQTQVWKQLAALRDPQVDELTRQLRDCCDPAWVPNLSLEMLLDRKPAAPKPAPVSAPQPTVPEQPWWERAAASSRPGQPERPEAPQPPRPPKPVFPISTAPTLPAPPPLSVPPSAAGTGPLPQLSRTMAPSAGTTWWTGTPQTGMPQPPQQPQQPQMPQQPLPPQPAPRSALDPRATGAAGLGLGMLILILGAVMNQGFLVFVGLALGAAGIWWLIARSGKPT